MKKVLTVLIFALLVLIAYEWATAAVPSSDTTLVSTSLVDWKEVR